ncbi:non-ribosomal peptide synthetase/type I polyketide synthase [Chromobacterium sp. ATCC 53434]|uniref:non-ribosomal peptide synthetase/type I polyketide synthase n=1 Tax=Chromobacterium sp. (strain ATCC 53434 / SC 14030) TaxID=2059672 RepID=UPI001305143F|nr:non-ribosomal peptide synthetase/type I polyketide synthase [Chromobacterium sp. ATCC 53434]
MNHPQPSQSTNASENCSAPSRQPERVAIIGAACRFPGANNLQSLKALLLEEREAVDQIAIDRGAIAADGVSRAGLIDPPDGFDPPFFGIAQREANQMDPQQRLVMELAVEALESAGIPRASLAGSRTGVYIGISTFDYSRLQMNEGQDLDLYAGTGNAFSIVANRLSYFLNLSGPSLAVDTACSSSLTATHLAIRALRAGEIDLAIAGGVNLLLAPDLMKVFAGAKMLSPDGRCKTFDAAADGYVRGEGAGIVVLKRASQLQPERERALALIAGSAVNQDGRTNGLTAPSGPAQVGVIRDALADAGLRPADIDAVELHGTGTPLGDPIEAQALGEVFAADREQALAVGSIKTNIGHLEAAAGIAGLLKGVIALREETLPRSLNFHQANPDIDLDRLKLAVAGAPVPLPSARRPARIGVSSFGFGGTNAHLILEAAPAQAPRAAEAEHGAGWLLPLSAASAEALRAQAAQYAALLERDDGASLADIVHTASLRRDHMDHRLAACGDRAAMAAALRAAATGRTHPGLSLGRRPAAGARKLALHGGSPALRAALADAGVAADTELDGPSDAWQQQLQGRWDILTTGLDDAAALPERLRLLAAPAEAVAALGLLYTYGHELDWQRIQPTGALTELPAYPWQRRRCWYGDQGLAARITDRPRHLLALAAASAETLTAQAEQALRDGAQLPPDALADFCHAANAKLAGQPWRASVGAADPDELRRGLQQLAAKPQAAPAPAAAPGVVFLLTGQGSALAGAGAELYASQPTFRDAIEHCSALLRPVLDVSLSRLLFDRSRGDALLQNTRYAQPAWVALSWSLAQLWADWGVRPAALLGHSLGEYTAAALSGMATIEQILPLVAARGALMQVTAGAAGMMAVKASAEQLRELVATHAGSLALAADNGPASCVLSGASDALAQAKQTLDAQGMRWRMLDVSTAFHSPLLDPVLARMAALAAPIDWQTGSVPVISNLSGLPHIAAPEGAYWAAHARGTVQFRQGVQTLLAQGHKLFLELGPRPTLSALGRGAGGELDVSWLSSLDGAGNDWQAMLDSAGALHNAGVDLDWTRFDQPYRRRALSASATSFPIPSSLEPAMPHVNSPLDLPSTAQAASDERVRQVRADLVRQIAKALGESEADLQTDRLFIEMGADSVMLAEAMRGIQASYGVKISARQLLNELNTIDRLSVHLAEQTAPQPAQAPLAAAPAPAIVPTAHAMSGDVNALFQQQLNLVQQVISGQLAALGGVPQAVPAPVRPVAAAIAALPAAAGHAPSAKAAPARAAGSSQQQAAHFAAFSQAYIARTATSKRLADERRERLADVRASAGFRPTLKEIVYPLTGNRADGARVWDVDGNEYIDISMDFGVNIFGHGAPFLKAALHEQADNSLALGTRSTLAGEVSTMLCEMTGMDRVLFCQSGSESLMTALRLARLLRDRSRVAVFRKSYHGHFDGLLGDRSAVGDATEPVAPGILPNFVSDLLMLDYCDDSALQAIEANADQLAAVLVEPMQSRVLDAQPREFLHKLREVTRRHGILLIFDEMITGFRCAPGGAQEVFGVEADLVTYGKTIGGGVPMAALAARGSLLDGIDGGIWRFGDDSAPDATTTFFAGTFNNHPLGLAMAHAVLKELKQRGPAFQQSLTDRTRQLTERLNQYFQDEKLPLSMIHFGSVFRFKHAGNLDLFYYHLLHRGLFVWEGRNCFLCDAHGQQEIDFIVDKVIDSIEALRAGGYLPARPAGAGLAAGEAPLSDTQRQIWLASQLDDSGAAAYCETVALELGGAIAPAQLERALAELSARHEALRTTVHGDKGIQRVHAELAIPLTLDQGDDGDGWLRAFAAAPFPLESGGPLQAGLFQQADGKPVLALRAHHILIDGWSLALVLEELGALLDPAGRSALEAAQPFRRQLEWLLSARDDQAEAFWGQRLADAPEALPLPRASAADDGQQARWQGERLRLPVPDDIANALTQLAVRQKATLFTTTLSLTLALFHALFDRDDILLGVPTHGRLDGLERMVGQAAQIMPLRSRLAPGARFEQLLEAVDTELEAMSEHQAYPLARLLEPVLAGGERPGALTVTFNLDRVRQSEFAGLPVTLLDAPVSGVKFDLAINLMQTPKGWLLDMDYQSRRYRREDIERLAGRWLDWAARVAADPAVELERANPLPAAELRQVLHGFNATANDKAALPVPQRIARQAALTPDAIAVTADGRHIDYRTLDLAARTIASELVNHGAGPEKIVAVMLPRSAELVATLLGIFYTGAAYMPIDPDEPTLRREEIFAETQPIALVTDAAIASRLAVGCPAIIVESPEELAAGWPSTADAWVNPAPVEAGDLAYVIYTSGSTNKPKGVLCTHGGLANLMQWTTERFPLDASDAVLQKAPYTFDISLWELCWPLLAGARLVVAPPETHRDPDYLARLIAAEQVTAAQFVPAMLEAFAATPAARECRSLRHLFAGGEALLPSQCAAVRELGLPALELHNLYGPTETTILVTHCQLRADELGPVPIGYPVANTAIRIVDSRGRPVGVGVEGDLLIGGAQLARGYLNRPEQNAAAFIETVAGDGAPQRLYRSGDRARWLDDGAVEYLGRVDNQIKLRGLRIEIGEIEHALRAHPAIQEAVVDLRGDSAATQRLLAWIVPRQQAEVLQAGDWQQALREYLAQRLPIYMIPAQFAALAALPLSRHGKIDRGALIEPRPDAGAVQAPRTPVEAELLDYARQTLALEMAGVEDNFFVAGGQSLAAAQLVTWAQQRFSARLALKDFLLKPTLAQLALLIGQAEPAAADDEGGLRSRERRRVRRDQIENETLGGADK